jgi:inorganic pyrophosphatase
MRIARSSLVLAVWCMLLAGCTAVDHPDPIAAGLRRVDRHTLAASDGSLIDHPPRNPDGTINVVVEIPAGTVAKWEVDKDAGTLLWEHQGGHPRVVRYLGYPANYGMVPGTLLAKADGGDGDPVDVVVLGRAVPRGSVVKARLIGALRMLDDGEKDDKLVAVMADTPFVVADSIRSLDRLFPGVTQIIEIWFTHYKGPGRITTRGYADVGDASALLTRAIQAFAEEQK